MNRIPLRSLTAAVAVALAGLVGTSSPVLAAPIGDGTSNTIQVAVTSATLDAAHHRVVVTTATPGGLTAGRHFATAQVVTPHSSFVFENVMVESLTGTSTALSLNFTKVEFVPSDGGACRPGVGACLIEEDGTYPPAP